MLTISTNVPSLSAQRTLMKNSQALNRSFQRLSTGLRINSAKDDAAGLAISNRLTSQVRGLNQAVRNASDATSMAQTAEAALNEQQGMLQRLRELAVQAANDTYTVADRQAIQQEADQLISEIDRIATQTSFNGRRLLDGSLQSISFQVGANENETVALSIRGARSFNLGAVTVGNTSSVDSTAIGVGEVTLNGVQVRATAATDDRLSSTGNTASAIAKAAAINAGAGDHGVTAEVNANTVTGGALTAGAESFTLNGATVSATILDVNDSDSALRNAINAVSASTGVTASLNGAGTAVVLTAIDGRNIDVAGLGGAGDSGLAAGTTYSTLSLKSEDAITVGGSTAARIGAGAGSFGAVRAVNVDSLDFTSQANATTAIEVVDDALSAISTRQSALGATLNRMDAAVSQLTAASENITAARSRVLDADFAQETAVFSKNQILQQASTAMLAQANVANQIALQLIG